MGGTHARLISDKIKVSSLIISDKIMQQCNMVQVWVITFLQTNYLNVFYKTFCLLFMWLRGRAWIFWQDQFCLHTRTEIIMITLYSTIFVWGKLSVITFIHGDCFIMQDHLSTITYSILLLFRRKSIITILKIIDICYSWLKLGSTSYIS